MHTYNWFQKIGKSLVPGEFYIHILKESIGKAIIYMILFILALSLIVGTYTGLILKGSMDATLADYNSGLIPPITIKDGQMSMEGTEAVVVPHFSNLVVIDDDYSYDINKALSQESYVLFHDRNLSITQNGVGPILYNYSDILMFDISPSDVATMLKMMGILMIPMSILSQMLVSIFGFFFNSLFLLLLGNILRTGARLNLSLKNVYHMVIYAMTFSVFWTHFSSLLPAPVPVWLDNIVYFAIPAIILLNVFLLIRKKALDDFNNRKD